MGVRERQPIEVRSANFVPRRRWRPSLSGLLMTLILLGLGTPAAAFNTNVVVDINAPFAASAQLTITPSAVNFPNADPDTTPSIPATENPLLVIANAQTSPGRTVTLTVLARGDLVSGSNTIPISNVRWTATGSGFRAGTLSKTAPQTAGSWWGSGSRSGTFSFFLANSWSYATGNYSQTITYTLTAP